MLTREKIDNLLQQWITKPNLYKHCLAVEAAMKAYANHFNIPEAQKQEWGWAGLIHDADWEKWPQQHPQKVLAWLQEQGASEKLLNAIASHGPEFGVPPRSLMAQTLRAVDELTGFIVAVTLVQPQKDLLQVSLESIAKKWKEKSFARGVNREFIATAVKELNLSLDEHWQIVLRAMQEIAPLLGLNNNETAN